VLECVHQSAIRFVNGFGHSGGGRTWQVGREGSNVEHDGLLELLLDQPLFIGFKVESALRQQLETLRDSDKKYISGEDSTFLRICRVGSDVYVGKVIHESLTTDRVEDIRRNVLSILHKLGGAVRLPTNLKILPCRTIESATVVPVPRAGVL